MIVDDVCRCPACKRPEEREQGWIGVDLDKTLAHYIRWGDIRDIGDPIWPMVERVKAWLAAGRRVKIFTARMAPPYEPEDVTQDDVRKAIEDWCLEHIGQKLEVTNIKDLYMIELWDDRAVQVEPNVGEPVTYWQTRVG